jgi:hypothetical protein
MENNNQNLHKIVHMSHYHSFNMQNKTCCMSLTSYLQEVKSLKGILSFTTKKYNMTTSLKWLCMTLVINYYFEFNVEKIIIIWLCGMWSIDDEV